MLRVALPNKGSLAEDSIKILVEAGYKQRSDSRDLVTIDEVNQIEFYYLRPRDIAIYVASGELSIGITGRDLLLDSGVNAQELLPLGFGKSTFRFGVPASTNGEDISILNGKRVATSYPGLVKKYLDSKSIKAEVVQLDGAVESAVRLGVADAIADVVSTGNTLRQAGLKVIGESMLESEAVLISSSKTSNEMQVLIHRLNSVIIARQYVLMDYDVKSDLVEAACALTPGIESPTISPLKVEGWMAIRAMVKRQDAHRIMDDLWSLGARGILVTDIHACRL
jgi:ATP phosphoribosyltransferase